jgi:hypothetical protein
MSFIAKIKAKTSPLSAAEQHPFYYHLDFIQIFLQIKITFDCACTHSDVAKTYFVL